jgi:hypothetical protein
MLREKQLRLPVIWGKYDLSFDLGEPERYRQDLPNAEVCVLDAGYFAPIRRQMKSLHRRETLWPFRAQS